MVTNTTATTELVDTGEKRDARGRRLTPAARRAELVAAWRQSGLTQAAFARQEGVKYPTFATWVQEGRRKGRPHSAGPQKGRRAVPVRFAEVRWPPSSAATAALAVAALGPTMPAASLEVRLPDGTVVRGDRATDLAALIRALRG